MNTNRRPVRKKRILRKQKRPFRINLTVVAFLLLIFGSIGAGIATGFATYRLGRESLSTVTTPQGNPIEKLVKTPNSKQKNEEFKITNEREILVRVYDFVVAKKEEQKAESNN